jgi:hypothetical protein
MMTFTTRNIDPFAAPTRSPFQASITGGSGARNPAGASRSDDPVMLCLFGQEFAGGSGCAAPGSPPQRESPAPRSGRGKMLPSPAFHPCPSEKSLVKPPSAVLDPAEFTPPPAPFPSKNARNSAFSGFSTSAATSPVPYPLICPVLIPCQTSASFTRLTQWVSLNRCCPLKSGHLARPPRSHP